MPVAPAARLDDGRLDLLVAGRFGRIGVAAMLPRLLAGRHLTHPRVLARSVVSIAATSAVAVTLAVDGEALGTANGWHVRVLPAALHAVRRDFIGRLVESR